MCSEVLFFILPTTMTGRPWICANVRDWESEVRRRLQDLRIPPARESEIVEELSQHLEDRYAELRAEGATWLRYAGAATFWDPPVADREAMRDLASEVQRFMGILEETLGELVRRVGAQLGRQIAGEIDHRVAILAETGERLLEVGDRPFLGGDQIAVEPAESGLYPLVAADRLDPVHRGDLAVMIEPRLVLARDRAPRQRRGKRAGKSSASAYNPFRGRPMTRAWLS